VYGFTAMAIVAVMCPQTGKHVSTGVEMDAAAFDELPYSRHFVFDCWICGNKHEWSRRWATLVGKLDRGVPEEASPYSGTVVRARYRHPAGASRISR